MRALKTGLTSFGPDLGSATFEPLERPQVVMAIGRGVVERAISLSVGIAA